MNYRNFLLLAERYYEPNEPLPSGKTPLERATQRNTNNPYQSSESLRKRIRNRIERTFNKPSQQELQRRETQKSRIDTVRGGGGDRKTINPVSNHPDIEVTQHGYETRYYHKPSSIRFVVKQKGYSNGRPLHSIEVDHNASPQNNRERISLINQAKSIYRNNVQQTLPHNSVLYNEPMPNYGKKGKANVRSMIYKDFGFGNLDDKGRQFALVNKRVSPKQAAAGATRLTALNNYDFGNRDIPNQSRTSSSRQMQQSSRSQKRSKISGNLATNTDQNFNSPTTGNPLLDRNRRRLPGSTGPAGVRLAD